MRSLITLLLILVFAQANSQAKLSLHCATVANENSPYVVVDTFRIADIKHLTLHPDLIQSVTVLKDSNAIKAYGELAKNGAILVKTKPGTRLLRLHDIYASYQVKPADQQLRVSVNNTVMACPEQLLLAATQIEKVEITKDKIWLHAEEADEKEMFLNIVTRK